MSAPPATTSAPPPTCRPSALLADPSRERHHPGEPCAARVSGDGLRVATLNLWGLRATGTPADPCSPAVWADLDADLLTLQEVIVTEDYDQARDLLGGYGSSTRPAENPTGKV